MGPGETFFAVDRRAWREWLAAHHAERSEIWLVLLKKHVAEPCVSLGEAVEEALCFGWIDGKLRRIDGRSHALRFTPRKPAGTWAPSNKARVARLMEEGRMTPAGLAAIEAARRSGAWDRDADMTQYDALPEDLRAALAAAPGAAQGFAAFPAAQRREYVRWVVRAVRPETRARHVAEVVRRAAAGIRPGMPG